MSGSVRLEPLAVHHAPLVFADLQDPALYTYIPDQPPTSLEALAARFGRYVTGAPPDERWLNWIVFADDVPVGHVQATVRDDRADVAWLIFPRYWRRGFAALAVRAMLRELAVPAVASIDPRNAASLALARSLGFVAIGIRDDGDVVLELTAR